VILDSDVGTADSDVGTADSDVGSETADIEVATDDRRARIVNDPDRLRRNSLVGAVL
jgi:hypothetical protein